MPEPAVWWDEGDRHVYLTPDVATALFPHGGYRSFSMPSAPRGGGDDDGDTDPLEALHAIVGHQDAVLRRLVRAGIHHASVGEVTAADEENLGHVVCNDDTLARTSSVTSVSNSAFWYDTGSPTPARQHTSDTSLGQRSASVEFLSGEIHSVCHMPQRDAVRIRDALEECSLLGVGSDSENSRMFKASAARVAAWSGGRGGFSEPDAVLGRVIGLWQETSSLPSEGANSESFTAEFAHAWVHLLEEYDGDEVGLIVACERAGPVTRSIFKPLKQLSAEVAEAAVRHLCDDTGLVSAAVAAEAAAHALRQRMRASAGPPSVAVADDLPEEEAETASVELPCSNDDY